MITSIATVTMGGSLPSRINAAASAGFEAVELFDSDIDEFGGDIATIRQMVNDAGLQVTSYFPLREIEGTPETAKQDTRDRAAAYLDKAVELGAPMVMMCSATADHMSGERSHILDDLAHLAEMAKERDLRIAYEAIAWGRHVSDYGVAAAIVSELQHPNFGLVLDNFHICASGHSLAPISDIPSEQLFLVQVSDAPQLEIDYLEWSRNYRTLPARGDFNLQAFTTQVQMTGYDGVFSLECFSDDLRNDANDQVAKEGFLALRQLWG